jgi:broad specificity phosphatase PhoE
MIYLVRHGSTNLNGDPGHDDRIRGWKNVPLNDQGREDAQKAAEEMKDKNISIIYCSDLIRAKETAEAIAKTTGAKVFSDPKLRPWNLGNFQGKKTKDALPIIEKYIDNEDTPVPDGESFRNFIDRFLGELRRLAHTYAGENIVIVAHYRNLKAAEAWQAEGFNGLEINKLVMKEDGIKPGKVYELDYPPTNSNIKPKHKFLRLFKKK